MRVCGFLGCVCVWWVVVGRWGVGGSGKERDVGCGRREGGGVLVWFVDFREVLRELFVWFGCWWSGVWGGCGGGFGWELCGLFLCGDLF